MFRPGEIWALLGPNGAGKSTLMKGVMGFPWLWRRGGALLDDRPLDRIPGRERAAAIGYLPQDPPVPQGLSVQETVLLGRHPFRSPWAPDSEGDREVCRRMMDLCDVAHLRDRPVGQLSGGERRMVFLASVLAQKPGLLLLDEPGGGLDYRHTVILWDILEELARGGATVVVSTHRLGMAGAHFRGAVLLGEGRCLGMGPPDKVFSPELMSRVYGIPLSVSRDPATGSWIVAAEGRQ